jgi:hypothetical protein
MTLRETRYRKLIPCWNSLEADVNVVFDDDGKPEEELTEVELRSLKKELRQMQRKAEGEFRIRCGSVKNV